MQRYFVKEDNWIEDQIVIVDDDAKHISVVMRMKEADQIICVHPNGTAARCTINHIEKNRVEAIINEVIRENSELPVQVTIVQGLPKGPKIDFVLQKGTELGAYAFQFFTAERSVMKWDSKKSQQKLLRFEKIVKEAAEQSHRLHIPVIHDVCSLDEVIKQLDQHAVVLFADEDAVRQRNVSPLQSVLKNITIDDHLYIVIGPEGGIADSERELLLAYDAISVRFGPRILRTETAAVYALACLSYQLEETME